MALLECTTAISLKNILWATDLSARSEAALPYALRLARWYDARVCVTHIVPPCPANPESCDHLFEERRRSTEQMVRRLGSRGSLHRIRHLVLVREGRITETLCNIIRDYAIDLLVIGARGGTGMTKILRGSVAQEVVRRAPCQVLSIGARCSGGIAEGIVPKSIICATDFSPHSEAALGTAVSLARDHHAQLTLVHVSENTRAQTHDGKVFLIETIQKRLKELAPQEKEGWCDLEFVVAFGSAAMQILELAEKLSADLIVLGSRHTSGLGGRLPGSTTYPVISSARCPVLTVPAPDTTPEWVRLGGWRW